MKITISPSDDQSDEVHPFYAVSVESPNDEAPIRQVIEMFSMALKSWGYNEEQVTEAMRKFEL